MQISNTTATQSVCALDMFSPSHMHEEHMAAASYFYQGASLIHLPSKRLEDALCMCEFGKCPEEH